MHEFIEAKVRVALRGRAVERRGADEFGCARCPFTHRGAVVLHALVAPEIFPELAREEVLARVRPKERCREGEMVRQPLVVGVEERDQLALNGGQARVAGRGDTLVLLPQEADARVEAR